MHLFGSPPAAPSVGLTADRLLEIERNLSGLIVTLPDLGVQAAKVIQKEGNWSKVAILLHSPEGNQLIGAEPALDSFNPAIPPESIWGEKGQVIELKKENVAYISVCLIGAGDKTATATLVESCNRYFIPSTELATLVKQSEKQKELDELKNTFVSTASHQLRTPLSVIKWVFSVLQSDAELKKMQDKMLMLNQAYEGIERIIDVVNDLLNLTRIQNGRIPFNPSFADPKKVIQDVCNGLKPSIESGDIAFTVDIAADIPEFQLDAILLKEMVQNVLNNAVDYNQEKGSITVKAVKQDSNMVITVTNTGIGITEADRAKVFQPFFRSLSAQRAHPDGSGLGLYLAKAIVQEHGGTISFVSEPDKQTTFTLVIPITISKDLKKEGK